MTSRLYTYLLIFSMIFCFIYCDNAQKSNASTSEKDIEKLKEEVLSIHDIAMARMDDIMTKKINFKKLLKEKIEKQENDTVAISKTIQQLDEANENMFRWMSNYKHDSTFSNIKNQSDYYKNQKTLVSKVAEDINNALKEIK